MIATVLVVEDEALIAADLQDALTHLGFDVPTTAATADDAVRLARELAPDLVLMDVTLRVGDGIEAAGRIRQERQVPLVFLTAHHDGPTLERARAVEPEGFLIKPFDERTLNATLVMALHKGRLEAERRERRRLLQDTLDRVDDVVIAVGRDGLVQLANDAGVRLGIRPRQEVGAALEPLGLATAAADIVALARGQATDQRYRFPGGLKVIVRDHGAVVLAPRVRAATEGWLCMCAWCRRAKDGEEWQSIEAVLVRRHGIAVTHGICEDCVEKHFSGV
jgi:CheY-like chemotaxis protein